MEIRGAITALVTPFTKNGGVNYDKLAELIEFQITNGADGIVLLGTTGESPTISEEEREAIIRTGVDTAAGRIPVIVGCGSNDTSKTADACRRAESLGADALLVLTPYYNKANADGMAAHFSRRRKPFIRRSSYTMFRRGRAAPSKSVRWSGCAVIRISSESRRRAGTSPI